MQSAGCRLQRGESQDARCSPHPAVSGGERSADAAVHRVLRGVRAGCILHLAVRALRARSRRRDLDDGAGGRAAMTPEPRFLIAKLCVHGSPHSRDCVSTRAARDADAAHPAGRLAHWLASGRTDARMKLLKRIALGGSRGTMYHEVEESLGVSRRYAKQLVGELRALGIVETVGNPATILVTTTAIRTMIEKILSEVDAEWMNAITPWPVRDRPGGRTAGGGVAPPPRRGPPCGTDPSGASRSPPRYGESVVRVRLAPRDNKATGGGGGAS
jgi:hypothetical protein